VVTEFLRQMMAEVPPGSDPKVPPATDAAIMTWMSGQGWNVAPARREMDPETGFYVWREEEPRIGKSHALWIAESMVRNLSAGAVVAILNKEGMAEELRISFKVRIEERGAEYRVSAVPRSSGEVKRMDL
jgi:hypothetical protein